MEANLQKNIRADLLKAMKEKDEVTLGVLRMIVSAFEKKVIEKRTAKGDAVLTPEEELQVVQGEAKKRREARELFLKGGRDDLAEKEASEISVIVKYLPPEVPRAEIEAAVKSAIAKTGASTVKDMGTVMKEAMGQLKGQADGGTVAGIIRELLG